MILNLLIMVVLFPSCNEDDFFVSKNNLELLSDGASDSDTEKENFIPNDELECKMYDDYDLCLTQDHRCQAVYNENDCNSSGEDCLASRDSFEYCAHIPSGDGFFSNPSGNDDDKSMAEDADSDSDPAESAKEPDSNSDPEESSKDPVSDTDPADNSSSADDAPIDNKESEFEGHTHYCHIPSGNSQSAKPHLLGNGQGYINGHLKKGHGGDHLGLCTEEDLNKGGSNKGKN